MAEVDEKLKRDPNFKGAASVIRSKLIKNKEDRAKLQGDASAEWAKVEGFGVNKKAAKHALAMLTMSAEMLQEHLRSLYGMMDEFGLSLKADLIDQAQGKGDQDGIIAPPSKPATMGESALVN